MTQRLSLSFYNQFTSHLKLQPFSFVDMEILSKRLIS
jgi:hypothetical protein